MNSVPGMFNALVSADCGLPVLKTIVLTFQPRDLAASFSALTGASQVGKSHCSATTLTPLGGGSGSGSSPWRISFGGVSLGPLTIFFSPPPPVSPPPPASLAGAGSPPVSSGTVVDEDELPPPPHAA